MHGTKMKCTLAQARPLRGGRVDTLATSPTRRRGTALTHGWHYAHQWKFGEAVVCLPLIGLTSNPRGHQGLGGGVYRLDLELLPLA